MRTGILALSLSAYLVASSCSKTEEDNYACLQECSAPAQIIRLHIIDYKSTESLIKPNSNEKNAINPHVRIYSLTRLKKDIEYRLERNKDGSYYIVFEVYGTDELEVKVDDLQTDTLKIETKYTTQECCGSLNIVKLQVNDSNITPPADNVIVLKK